MQHEKPEHDPSTTSGISPPDGTSAAPTKHHYVAEGFKNRTWGEGIFNALSYIGIGYFGVTAISVAMTWLLRDTKLMAPRFKKFVDFVTDKTPFLKTNTPEQRKAAFDFYDNNLTILAMFTGGTLATVLPVKWLEDSKAKIVQWFDKKIYGEERVANDPHLIRAHWEMEQVPQQTWRSVIASRVTAFAATYGTSMLVGSNESLGYRATGHSIRSLSTRGGRAIDSYLNRKNPGILGNITDARTLDPINPVANERLASKIWQYVVMDAMYTAITASSLFVFTRIFAPLLGKKVPEEGIQVANDNFAAANDNIQARQTLAVNAPEVVQEKTEPKEKPSAKVVDFTPRGRVSETKAELAPVN